MPDIGKGSIPRRRDIFAERHARVRDRLSPAFVRVADFIDANRMDVLTLPALELGRLIGTSDATVIRAVQALGFTGLQDLRTALAACYEARNAPADNLTRTWAEVGESAEAAMDGVIVSLMDALSSLRTDDTRDTIRDALKILHVARRIVVFGIGPTAHIAGYFAARLRRKGRRQMVLDRTGAGLADQLLDLEDGDAVLMLAYGRPYREAEAVMTEARRHRHPVVLITDAPNEALARAASVILAIPRGRQGHIALHGTTIACLEILLLGLATTDRDTAIDTLKELERLRKMMHPARRRVSSGLNEETEK